MGGGSIHYPFVPLIRGDLNKFKLMISSLLLVLCCLPLSAEEVTDTLVVYFRQNSVDYDPAYMKNAERFETVIKNIQELQQYPDFKITKLECRSSSSPEGSVIFNEYISRERNRAALRILNGYFDIPDSLCVNSTVAEDWDTLAELLNADHDFTYRDAVLRIINENEDPTVRENYIKKYSLDVWNKLSARYFSKLRTLRVQIHVSYTLPEPEVVQVEEVPVVETVIEQKPEPEPPIKEITDKKVTLKTNLIGWAAMGANLAVEVDLAPHLSISLPIHYSGGVEYMETLKFRCIVFQPELRYYPWLNKGRNQGFFLGLHGGAGHYNFAFDGDFRYQDKDGRRPAYGGGLGMGCSFRFGKNTGWGMEIAVSGGVYDAEYDIFYNEPNGPYYKKGVRSLWYGVDNASLSLFYKFDIKKKRGVK